MTPTHCHPLCSNGSCSLPLPISLPTSPRRCLTLERLKTTKKVRSSSIFLFSLALSFCGMKEAAKPPQSSAVVSDLKALFCPFGTRRTKVFLYGSAFAFVAFSAYLAFCPPEKTSPWFDTLFSSANVSTAPYRSQISSLVSHIFPNSSPPPSPDNMPADGGGAPKGGILWGNATTAAGGVAGSNKTADGVGVKNLSASESGLPRSGVTEKNRTASGSGLQGGGYSMKNQTTKGGNGISTSDQGKDGVGPAKATTLTTKNRTTSGIGPPKSGDSPSKNLTVTGAPPLRNNETETGVGSLKNGHLPVKNQRGKGVAASKANPVPPNSKESAANAPKNGAAANNQSSSGKDYYQEGSHIYSDLNVVNAFRKALNTWAKWVDANVNSKSSLVFFRGYSVTHFRYLIASCDKETEPIENENYLSSYPWKMTVLESVIKGMRTPVAYLNITRMTDYRKDAHPSIYRKQNLTEEERRSPERYQDCSHWCLPGVPDSWNELLYAQLLINRHQLP
ncbi:hypothetical protein BHE74_00059059 [Ensete ventricosum]|nr:hypothetical protein BHE74_00059059 [Ensete ventricosum]